MSLYYLGSFPPPRGGVTVKNENLLRALQQQPGTAGIIPIDFSRLKQKDFGTLGLLIKALCSKDSTFVVGVAGRKYRKWLIQLLYRVNRPAMERSVLILMGGLAANDIVNDAKVRKCAASFKRIYGETESMVRTLQAAGLPAGYYPNGRFRPEEISQAPQQRGIQYTIDKMGQAESLEQADELQIPDGQWIPDELRQSGNQRIPDELRQSGNQRIPDELRQSENQPAPLHIVYFSLISEPKGAVRTVAAAAQLPNMTFSFYGPVDPEYKEQFQQAIKDLPNVTYKGIFQGDSSAVYQELGKYDAVVLPTSWKAEGVPGILIEAKIAGLAAVVSDFAFNAEIVEDRKSGLVLKENSPEEIRKALQYLDSNRALLESMKKESRRSAEKYYIENFVDEIASTINVK